MRPLISPHPLQDYSCDTFVKNVELVDKWLPQNECEENKTSGLNCIHHEETQHNDNCEEKQEMIRSQQQDRKTIVTEDLQGSHPWIWRRAHGTEILASHP